MMKKDLLSGLDYMHPRKLSIPPNGGIGTAIFCDQYDSLQLSRLSGKGEGWTWGKQSPSGNHEDEVQPPLPIVIMT